MRATSKGLSKGGQTKTFERIIASDKARRPAVIFSLVNGTVPPTFCGTPSREMVLPQSLPLLERKQSLVDVLPAFCGKPEHYPTRTRHCAILLMSEKTGERTVIGEKHDYNAARPSIS